MHRQASPPISGFQHTASWVTRPFIRVLMRAAQAERFCLIVGAPPWSSAPQPPHLELLPLLELLELELLLELLLDGDLERAILPLLPGALRII